LSSVRFGSVGSLVTDADGRFEFPLDLHDTDTVETRVSAPGFQTTAQTLQGWQFTYGPGYSPFRLFPIAVPSPTPPPANAR